MPDWQNALRNLVPGDIIHATTSGGPSRICLIESVTDQTIGVRIVTIQHRLEFDRNTGTASQDDGRQATIDSIAPLPLDKYNVLIGLDRKMRLERDLTKHKLTDDERQALLFVGPFYSSNPLLDL